jgi:hypothetical protein
MPEHRLTALAVWVLGPPRKMISRITRMGKEFEEGWYTDPFGRHEARWLSDGQPTKLVRDAEIESYDEPPDAPPVQDPVMIEPDPKSFNPEDLLRADDAEADPNRADAKDLRRADDKEAGEPFDSRSPVDAAFDALPQSAHPGP